MYQKVCRSDETDYMRNKHKLHAPLPRQQSQARPCLSTLINADDAVGGAFGNHAELGTMTGPQKQCTATCICACTHLLHTHTSGMGMRSRLLHAQSGQSFAIRRHAPQVSPSQSATMHHSARVSRPICLHCFLSQTLKNTARARKAQLDVLQLGVLQHTDPHPPQAVPGLACSAVHTA